jgi:PhnB protein
MSLPFRGQKVSTYFCTRGAAEAIDFYKKAFGAEELFRLPEADGRIGHAEIRIGDTVLMLADEHPEVNFQSPHSLSGTTMSFALEVDDADAAYAHAVSIGATADRPLRDEPYGRIGWLKDPYGYTWSVIQSNPDFRASDSVQS